MVTTIQISDQLWTQLNRLKLRGDTFEDVIYRLLINNKRLIKENYK